jgi:hypothetical protein
MKKSFIKLTGQQGFEEKIMSEENETKFQIVESNGDVKTSI